MGFRDARLFTHKNKLLFSAIILTAITILTIAVILLVRMTQAESLPDDARVYENDELTYYISVNSDGIDYEGSSSSDAQIVKEYSGTTEVSDVIPDGLIFEGFVASSDGTFGAVSRGDESTECSGHVIDDTNEESVTEGSWNAGETEYTYHGLHYNSTNRTVTFKTRGITAGCKLTIGVKVRTPYLRENEFRKDFYNTASFVDESIFGTSNTVHAYIQRSRPVVPPDPPSSEPTEKPEGSYYSITYRYEGDIPEDAPELPAQQWLQPGSQFTLMDTPNVECYDFDGWWWKNGSQVIPATALNGVFPGFDIEFYGTFTRTCPEEPEIVGPPTIQEPEKYNVTYEVEGEKPESFVVPKRRSYYVGASVDVDTTQENEIVDGYSFSGWDSNDIDVNQVATFSMPAKNITLRGNFEREQFTVSYEYVGDVIPSGANALLPATQSYYAGDLVTVADDVAIDGYTFSGWVSDHTFEMPDENVVIRGSWQRIQQEFRPEISIKITNPKEVYHKGDTISFETEIKNTQNIEIQDLYVQELLQESKFLPSSGYSVENDRFAKIAALSANSSIKLYSELKLNYNIDKTWVNEVEIISFETADDSYKLASDYNNKASVDFVSERVEGVPEDYDPDPEVTDPTIIPEDKPNPKTFDGIDKIIVSGVIVSASIIAIVIIAKKERRNAVAKYSKIATIATTSLVMLVIYNGGISFADGLEVKDEIGFTSQADYLNHDDGSWYVRETASWTDVATAQVVFNVASTTTKECHNQDIILVLDNSSWTSHAVDGTTVDMAGELTSLEKMKVEASEYVDKLLANGDSSIVIMSVWGDETPVKTTDPEVAKAAINAINTTDNDAGYSYRTAYMKVYNFMDSYHATSGNDLKVMFVLDDHVANSEDIANYRKLKEKLNGGEIVGIGFGSREIMRERYTSASAAAEYGVARFWSGVDGNAHDINWYNKTVLGQDQISDKHSEPLSDDLDSALASYSGNNIPFESFNLLAQINTSEFDIVNYGMSDGSVSVAEGNINWTLDDKLMTGTSSTNLVVNLRAKDDTLSKHKLYQLTNSARVQSSTRYTTPEDVQNNEKLVLMNGFELSYALNNPGTCTAGSNTTSVVWAMQLIQPDEEGIECEGWNFDSFQSDDGVKYTQDKPNRMAARDLNLKATWRKTDVEIHMDGTIYVAAPATLATGSIVRSKLYDVQEEAYDASGYSSTVLLKADECPSYAEQEANRISDDDSPTPIYAYVVEGTVEGVNPNDAQRSYTYRNPTYYCSEVDEIFLNEDSSHLFDTNAFEYLDPEIANWKTSKLKDMSYIIARDRSYGYRSNYNILERLSEWDVSGVDNMTGVFSGWSFRNADLEKLPDGLFANWNTSNVTNMSQLFAATNGFLDKIPALAELNTSKVTDMSGILANTQNTDYSVVSDWNTSNVENLADAFRQSQLKNLNLIKDWDVRKVKDMSRMLEYYGRDNRGTSMRTDLIGASSLGGLENWQPDSLENLKSFLEGASIDDLSPIGGWDVSKVTDMSELLYETSYLTNLQPLSSWRTNSLTDISGLIRKTQITDIGPLGGWNVSKVIDMGAAFAETPISDISALAAWSVPDLENLSSTFYHTQVSDISALEGWRSPKLKSLTSTFAGTQIQNVDALEEWKTGNLQYLNKTFYEASALTDISGLHKWDVKKVTNMESLFANTAVSSLEPLSEWETSSLENLLGFLENHWNLESLDGLEGWDTSNVSYFGSAFKGRSTKDPSYTNWLQYCDSKLTDISAISGWNVRKIESLTEAFACNDKLTSISSLSSWEPVKVQYLTSVFAGDKSLTKLDGIETWADMDYKTPNPALSSMDFYMDGAFMDCSGLTDITALTNWDARTRSLRNLLRNDSLITDLSPLNNLNALGKYSWTNAFEGIPQSVTRPNWYQE